MGATAPESVCHRRDRDATGLSRAALQGLRAVLKGRLLVAFFSILLGPASYGRVVASLGGRKPEEQAERAQVFDRVASNERAAVMERPHDVFGRVITEGACCPV